jgi:hypothetical protein
LWALQRETTRLERGFSSESFCHYFTAERLGHTNVNSLAFKFFLDDDDDVFSLYDPYPFSGAAPFTKLPRDPGAVNGCPADRCAWLLRATGHWDAGNTALALYAARGFVLEESLSLDHMMDPPYTAGCHFSHLMAKSNFPESFCGKATYLRVQVQHVPGAGNRWAMFIPRAPIVFGTSVSCLVSARRVRSKAAVRSRNIAKHVCPRNMPRFAWSSLSRQAGGDCINTPWCTTPQGVSRQGCYQLVRKGYSFRAAASCWSCSVSHTPAAVVLPAVAACACRQRGPRGGTRQSACSCQLRGVT